MLVNDFYLKVKVGTKTKNQSSLRKYDYITRRGKHEYFYKGELVTFESGNMPEWAKNPRVFWIENDRRERKNALLYREIIIKLPTVLSYDQKINLARKFAAVVVGDRGFTFTIAFHKMGKTNAHAHILFSERICDSIPRTLKKFFKKANKAYPETGGAIKAQIGSYRRKWLKEIIKLWEIMANRALKDAGRNERIDCRSLIEQGINRVSQVHLGQAVIAMEARGIKTDKVKLNQRIEKINNNICDFEGIEMYIKQRDKINKSKFLEIKKQITETSKNLPDKNIQEIVENFIRQIKKEVKIKMIRKKHKMNEIKKIIEAIEQAYWEKKNEAKNNPDKKIFAFGRKAMNSLEIVIRNLENDTREFDEEREKRIKYFEKELRDCISEIYFEKKSKGRLSRPYIEDGENNNEEKERLKNMPIDEFMEEMKKKFNLKDEKPKAEQSKIEQFEQGKAKQPENKQTEGLEIDREEDEETTRKKPYVFITRNPELEAIYRKLNFPFIVIINGEIVDRFLVGESEAIELAEQTKTNESENEQNTIEQNETKQPENEQSDKAVSEETILKEDNKKLIDETGSDKDGPDEDGPGKGGPGKSKGKGGFGFGM